MLPGFLSNTQLIFVVLAVIISVPAAWLRYKASYQLPSEQDEGRRWFDAKWRKIQASPWLHLPEVVIGWLVRARDSLSKPREPDVVLSTIAILPVLIIGSLWIRANQVHVGGLLHLQRGIGLISVATILLYGVSLITIFLPISVYLGRIIYITLMTVLTGLGVFVWIFFGLDYDHRNAVLLHRTHFFY